MALSVTSILLSPLILPNTDISSLITWSSGIVVSGLAGSLVSNRIRTSYPEKSQLCMMTVFGSFGSRSVRIRRWMLVFSTPG